MTWAGVLGAGLYYLNSYEARAGAAAGVSARWPAEGPALASEGVTIVVFLHPECPCSRATVASLDQIMAHGGGHVRAYVVGVMEEGAPSDWEKSGLLKRAGEIP